MSQHYNTRRGKCYAVTPTEVCTVTTMSGIVLATCEPGRQTIIVAPDDNGVIISENNALFTDSFSLAALAASGGGKELKEHLVDTTSHVSADERTAWNDMASATQAALLGLYRGFYEQAARQTADTTMELYGTSPSAQSGLLILSAPPEWGAARSAPRYLVVHGNVNDGNYSAQGRLGAWVGEECDATITASVLYWNPLMTGVRKLSMNYPNVTNWTSYCFCTNVSNVPGDKRLEVLKLSFPVATKLFLQGAGNPGNLQISSYTLRAPALEISFLIKTAARVVTNMDVQLPSCRSAANLPIANNYGQKLQIPAENIEAYLASLPDWTEDTAAGYVAALEAAGVTCPEDAALAELLALAADHAVSVAVTHPLSIWATDEGYAAVVAWAASIGVEPVVYTAGSAPVFNTLPGGWTISYNN